MNRRGAVALAAVAIACAGCGPQQGPPTMRDDAVVRMHAMPAGTVERANDPSAFSRLGTVRAVMTGLQPDSQHPVWLGTGGCDTAGKVLAGSLAADGSGRGAATLHGAAPSPSAPWWAVISVGPGTTDQAETTPLACAAIPDQGPATLTPSSPFSAAHVAVQMSYDLPTRVLTVRVRASGLAARSRHPNHIHTGQCESEGPVREVLRTLDADGQGRAEATTTVPQSDGIKPGAWYVAVHNGPALDSQAQYALLACGNVSTLSSVRS